MVEWSFFFSSILARLRIIPFSLPISYKMCKLHSSRIAHARLLLPSFVSSLVCWLLHSFLFSMYCSFMFYACYFCHFYRILLQCKPSIFAVSFSVLFVCDHFLFYKWFWNLCVSFVFLWDLVKAYTKRFCHQTDSILVVLCLCCQPFNSTLYFQRGSVLSNLPKLVWFLVQILWIWCCLLMLFKFTYNGHRHKSSILIEFFLSTNIMSPTLPIPLALLLPLSHNMIIGQVQI